MGGEFNQTVIHPLGFAVFLLCAIYLFSTKRSKATLPILLLMCLVPTHQRLSIAGADFTLMRLLLLVGIARVTIKHEWKLFTYNKIDRLVLFWFGVTAVASVAVRGEISYMLFQVGRANDVLAIYFLFRVFIRQDEDISNFIKYIVVIACVVSIFFIIEFAIGRNLFSIFGGVPEYTAMRAGRIRAQGAFLHPILAGCFWAALVPFAWAYTKTRGKQLGYLGIAAMIFMVITSASSTSLLSFSVCVAGLLFYKYRSKLRTVVISGLVMLTFLTLALKGPPWSLFAKVNVIGGSTGWHRYYLIDEAVNRVSEWWLFGTTSTAHWGWGLWDVTNSFVAAAVRGGLLGLLLFNILVFSSLSVTYYVVKKAEGKSGVFAWAIFVSLFVDFISFQGVTYIGQIEVIWFAKLAMVASLYQMYTNKSQNTQINL